MEKANAITSSASAENKVTEEGLAVLEFHTSQTMRINDELLIVFVFFSLIVLAINAYLMWRLRTSRKLPSAQTRLLASAALAAILYWVTALPLAVVGTATGRNLQPLAVVGTATGRNPLSLAAAGIVSIKAAVSTCRYQQLPVPSVKAVHTRPVLLSVFQSCPCPPTAAPCVFQSCRCPPTAAPSVCASELSVPAYRCCLCFRAVGARLLLHGVARARRLLHAAVRRSLLLLGANFAGQLNTQRQVPGKTHRSPAHWWGRVGYVVVRRAIDLSSVQFSSVHVIQPPGKASSAIVGGPCPITCILKWIIPVAVF